MKQQKILVEMIELNEYTYFKKFPIKQGQVLISNKGGRGNQAEAPALPDTYFYKKGLIGEKKYAKYRRGTNRFMTKDDSNIPPLSLELIQTWINNKSFKSFFGDKEVKLISYLLLGGIGLIVILNILPYIR